MTLVRMLVAVALIGRMRAVLFPAPRVPRRDPLDIDREYRLWLAWQTSFSRP